MSISRDEEVAGGAKRAAFLTLVIPAFNEEASVVELRAEIDAAMSAVDFPWEAVWVDDGSTDRTCERLRGFLPPHRYLRFLENCGQSAALVAGIRSALGEWIATLDGDGQNDPRDIRRQLEYALANDLDMVNGIRTERSDNAVRRVSSCIANRYRRRLLGDSATDVGCSTRVVRRVFVYDLPFFDGLHRYLPALVEMRGGSMGEIPVNHRPRRAGHSKYGIRNRLWVGLRDVQGVRWLKARHRRWTIAERSPGGGRSE